MAGQWERLGAQTGRVHGSAELKTGARLLRTMITTCVVLLLNGVVAAGTVCWVVVAVGGGSGKSVLT